MHDVTPPMLSRIWNLWSIRGLLYTGLLLGATNANAAVCNSLASGNWNVAATWSCDATPGATDDVTINAGHNISLNGADRQAQSFTIAATGTLTTGSDSLTIQNNGVVQIDGVVQGNGNNASRFIKNGTGGLSGTGSFNDLQQVEINGDTTIAAGTTLTFTGDECRLALAAGVDVINNGVVTYDTPASCGTASTLTLTGTSTWTNNGTVSAETVTGGSGAIWTNAENSVLNVRDAFLTTAGTVLNASANPNTVNYSGTIAQQTVKLPSGGNYYHLTLSGSGNKNPVGGSTYNILGNFTVNAGPTWRGTAPGTDPNVNISGNLVVDGTFTAGDGAYGLAGNFTHNGTFTTGTGVFTFNGSAAQTLDGTATNTTIANLTMGNTAVFASRTLTIGHDVTVSTLLTFNAAANTGGRIVTGSAKVIIPSTGNITNASGSATESDFIAGRLQRYVAAGASTVAFPVGSDGAALPAAAYTPASLSFTGVAAGGGSLIVYVGTPLGDHPDIATSGLDSGKSVNRWWALTTSGVSGTALPAFTDYSATFTFISPEDIDSGANTANFEIERRDGGTWNTTTVGTRTGTTTQATGITALGECAIAEKVPVVTTPGDFNAFETSTAAGAITGKIYTKLVGTNFSLDVMAILSGAQHATFTNTVQADLVTGSTGGLNCPGTPVAIPGTSQNVSLTNGRGTTGNFNVAAAYADVRVRMRYPVASPTVTSCSTDNFSIRPTAFTVTSTNATNNAASGPPAIKTGANFNLTAASVAGYNGTPAIDNTKVAGSPNAGAIGGSFAAALPATGTAAGDSFFYSEVGNFGLNANAVYDSSFTSVDQSGDCTADFSNSLAGGKYGCSFGSTAVAQTTGSSGFGRFIPDNFDVSYNTPAFATGCGTFTYTGAPILYGTAPLLTVTARNGTSNGLSNATTTNYAGDYMKLTSASLTLATQAARYSRYDALGGGATPALDTSGLPATSADPAIGTFTNGVGNLTFGSGTGLSYTRGTSTPHVPFDADISLAINVIDDDGVAHAGNPASFGAPASGNGIAFSSGKPIRYGILRLDSAYGSELLNLPVPVQALYWSAAPSNFVINSADSCTMLAAGNVAFDNFKGALASLAISGINPITSGRGRIVLTKPGVTGSADMAINLGGSTADASCNTLHPLTTGANLAWLRGKWCGPGFDKDPGARVRFGTSKAPYIYLRERY